MPSVQVPLTPAPAGPAPRALATARLALAMALLAAPAAGVAQRLGPESYGRVVLARTSRAAGMVPVGFDHWRHRARYTCRVCHVDVGFAMSAGESQISAETNRAGYHCGACHDGKTRHAGGAVFGACASPGAAVDAARCARCHAKDDPERRRRDYRAFAAELPRRASGEVDWEAAESSGAIRPLDFVEGTSIQRPALRRDVDVVIGSKGWMTDVIFSHRKHAAWNGCEVCHPEIFPSRSGEGPRPTMLEINDGRSCGVCHGLVAFPVRECERCHVGRKGP